MNPFSFVVVRAAMQCFRIQLQTYERKAATACAWCVCVKVELALEKNDVVVIWSVLFHVEIGFVGWLCLVNFLTFAGRMS